MEQRQIFTSPEELARAAAGFIVELAQTTVRETGRFTLSLSGGKTPELLFEQMAALPYRDEMPWHSTLIFWGDERCVPADSPRHNANIAKSILLDRVAIPDSNIFPVPVEQSPEAAALLYEQLLHEVFDPEPPRFDLILLGLGADGHTASLFPETPVVKEKTRWMQEVYVASQQMYRVTMTLPLINQAKNILFLVSGYEKAIIAKTVLEPESRQHTYPAQLVRPEQGVMHWFLDNAAATFL